MDLETIYLLMNKRYTDDLNNINYVPEEILDLFPPRKVKTHHKYINIEGFVQEIFDYFFYYRYDISGTSTLKLEDDIEINFNFARKAKYPSYAVSLTIQNTKNKNAKCIELTWVPFARLLELDSLFYNDRKDKIEPNIECDVKNIPAKAGDFFLKLIEDLSNHLGVKTITLYDASLFYLDKKYKLPLGLYYLQEKGTTYYGKYGFKPYKANGIDYVNMYYGIPFKSDQKTLDYIKAEVKKMKKLKETKREEWFKEINELSKFFPRLYYKKL